ncbi:MAG: hypothetical protein QW103_02820 [Candidatus Pacearchaeota archaeon]
MQTETYNFLREISKNFSEVGKVLQCLLGLAFYKALEKCNPYSISINLVEGVDINIECESFKYAVEVKITQGDHISLKKKDFEGLKKFKEKGYLTLIGILRLDLHSEWIFVHPEKFAKRKYTWKINELYTEDFFKELGKKINDLFESLILNYASQVKEKGLRGVLAILKKENIRYFTE